MTGTPLLLLTSPLRSAPVGVPNHSARSIANAIHTACSNLVLTWRNRSFHFPRWRKLGRARGKGEGGPKIGAAPKNRSVVIAGWLGDVDVATEVALHGGRYRRHCVTLAQSLWPGAAHCPQSTWHPRNCVPNGDESPTPTPPPPGGRTSGTHALAGVAIELVGPSCCCARNLLG